VVDEEWIEIGRRIRDVHVRDGSIWVLTEHSDGEVLRLRPGATVSAGDGSATLPARFHLAQNHPNPFNPTTTIRFDLPAPAEVRLVIYDVIGREIATVVSESLDAGRHEVAWNAAHLPSGVYVYRLDAGDSRKERKMVLVK
jgi:hypothetical protein